VPISTGAIASPDAQLADGWTSKTASARADSADDILGISVGSLVSCNVQRDLLHDAPQGVERCGESACDPARWPY